MPMSETRRGCSCSATLRRNRSTNSIKRICVLLKVARRQVHGRPRAWAGRSRRIGNAQRRSKIRRASSSCIIMSTLCTTSLRSDCATS
ncbi:hypothetical protein PYCCODRAFT_1158325 [Trametes coccinea BRFM310]|uniref:Uncharacterized protein n=1 Tax=Trametes coccinea (strain BRFM310) TaxID=1353009 RepID=A0A1Y2IY79_TRAC3|nr:hypothetical protein PYCCODRAFT_1158325 [Trametes coccinea BRFM310]